MSITKPRSLLRIAYYEEAQAYLRNLPQGHFMEAVPQATQREITLESLALVKANRPDLYVFNELLVQYPFGKQEKIRQVVPDNMMVLSKEPIQAEGSFDVPFQPARPFCMMEYVSKSHKRKDYEISFRYYERELKVPYYLLFYPDGQELTLFRHNGRKYVTVKPNDHGRYAIPDLDLEVALVDGWVRYWYKGRLLPLPADLQRELEATRRQLRAANRRADDAERRAEAAAHQADEATRQAEQATHLAEEAARQAKEERQARLMLEQHLEQLRRNGR